MEKKPNLIIFLVIMWLIIGISFVGLMIYSIINFLDYTPYYIVNTHPYETYRIFSFVINLLLYLYVIIGSIYLIYYTLLKKRRWVLGIIFSSSLLYAAYFGIQTIGTIFIYGGYADFVQYLPMIPIYLSMVLSPICIYILLKPTTKKYYNIK